MNWIVSSLAILGGLLGLATAAPLPDRVREYAAPAALGAGWLGVVAGTAILYLEGAAPLTVLIATAACAGLIVLPAAEGRSLGGSVGPSLGGALVLVGGLASLFVDGGVETVGQTALLFAAQAGAFGAALVSALIAAGFADLGLRGERDFSGIVGLDVPASVAVMCGGAILVGHARGGPVGTGWSLPLRSGGEPVQWTVPGIAELPQGLSIDAVTNMPALTVLASLAAACALVSALLPIWRPDDEKRSLLLLVVGGGLSLFSALVAALVGKNAGLPENAEPYAATARALLADADGAEAVVEEGEFAQAGEEVYVALGDLIPELSLLVAAGLVVLVVAARLRWGDAPAAEEGEGEARTPLVLGLHARDYTLRAVLLGWLAWLLGILIHWQYYGAIGVGSPAEWTGLGLLLVASGVALVGWRRRDSTVLYLARRLGPAVVFALFVAGLVTAVIFEAPFGVAMVF
ncbi:MAG: hypothetical protein ACOCV2_13155 [Persicimonas sp.]